MGKGKLAILTLTFIFTVILNGCGPENKTNSADTKSDGKISVYTTVFPLADFTKKIGGDYVDVQSIYPPGVDEHSYEPTQKEIIDMANGDLFFAIGYNLEGFVKKAQPILKEEGVKVVPVGEQVHLATHENDNVHSDHAEHSEDEEHGLDHGGVDPHIWLDPVYSIELANAIKENLIEKMPEQKETFEKNFESLKTQLEQLNKQFTEVANQAKVKKFIVSHAAYGYWEERYGLEQLNISGISTSQEPTQKQLMAIVDEVKANQLKYILVEQNVHNKLVDVIQSETNISTLPIHNLSVLTENDLKHGEDYFSLMEKNLETLKTALNE